MSDINKQLYIITSKYADKCKSNTDEIYSRLCTARETAKEITEQLNKAEDELKLFNFMKEYGFPEKVYGIQGKQNVGGFRLAMKYGTGQSTQYGESIIDVAKKAYAWYQERARATTPPEQEKNDV